jgi:Tol biopolymer transport system component
VRFRIPAPAGIVSADVPKLSPDGRYVAFNGTDSLGTTRIWIQPLDALQAHSLAGTEDALRPFWSPDSKELAFFAGDQLKRIGVEGGTVRVLCDGVNGADGSWSQEGVILFDGAAGDSIRSVPASGGVPRGASRIDRASGQMMHAWPHFLPDGKHYLFQAQYANGSDSLLVGELGSTETKLLGPAASLMGYSDPGYVLWVQGGALRAQRLNLKKLELVGEPFPVTTQLGVGTTGLASFSASLSGVLAYRSGDTGLRRLTWVDRTGKRLRTTGPAGYYTQPDLDPTEHLVVVERTDSPSAKSDLWILDDTREVSSRFTYDEAVDIAGLWSPDGRQIAFASNRSGPMDVYLKNADGTGQTIPVWQDSMIKLPTDWSPDGKTLLVQRRLPNNVWNIWSLALDGKSKPQPVIATTELEAQGRFSPDGRWIAYSAWANNEIQVYVRAASGEGGKWQISLDGGSEPDWRGDGKELYFLGTDRRLMAVDVDTSSGFRAGAPHPLFRANVSPNYVTRDRYRAAKDGQSFLLLASDSGEVSPITVVLNWTAEIEKQ